MTHRPIRFGAFEMDRDQRRLVSRGEALRLGPRAFDVLATLVERPGELVTKDELLARVWPRLVVEEGNLPVQISALRKVLGADFIETVSGSGYRFRGDVEAAEVDMPALAARHNLVPQLSTFVGRGHDMAALRERLQSAPLVTIVGVGGLGKSRLALGVAQDVVGEYHDGVWWVDLAPIADPSMVPHAVAAALAVPEGKSVTDSLDDRLASRRTLLVLDNCEHVLGACAELAYRMLRNAAHLKILATSREALHIFGESVYLLPGLSLPATDNPIACDSVSLFVDRAAAVNPALRIGDRELSCIARICRHLDGIPLAIELAAARVRMLSLSAIEGRLASRFALLTGGDRTALPRQQALRATIDWSYDLLTADERTLLARLAVFAGGCALEDAEAVAAGGRIAAPDVLDVVTRLVDKSLLEHDVSTARYRMLETIREYAQERLEASDEAPAVRDRHLAHFLAQAQQAEPEMHGPDWARWMARLTVERDNFLAAHAWCGQAGHAESGLLLLDALRIWLFGTSIELGERLAREALAWPGSRRRGRARCLGEYAAASIAYYAGHNEDAIAHGEECLAIAREIGEALKALDALIVIGVARMGAGDRKGARAALVEALSRARELAHPVRLCDAATNLAELYTADGEPALAIPLYEESASLSRAIGNTHGVALQRCNLARNHLMCGTRDERSAALARRRGGRGSRHAWASVAAPAHRLRGPCGDRRGWPARRETFRRGGGGSRSTPHHPRGGRRRVSAAAHQRRCHAARRRDVRAGGRPGTRARLR